MRLRADAPLRFAADAALMPLCADAPSRLAADAPSPLMFGTAASVSLSGACYARRTPPLE